eukprot:CAMPEP_0119115968 /NCGR_PEP_ID=MMETSP1180-20130426/52031_1 /TAXON_ID=3052 ORGANISM="Chlamydomonas cf sp, Strain CCMP681" /NCGR_SAMPLE_ID=MMETSP1180 /ASSEMBLY_ACC=CAM_ASM_000741 /LENGTH=323 /DNA_ID=CAMNT_0007105077 /DNA_START=588 /DNA_END=1559 /DNA_ORIENTATION=-
MVARQVVPAAHKQSEGVEQVTSALSSQNDQTPAQSVPDEPAAGSGSAVNNVLSAMGAVCGTTTSTAAPYITAALQAPRQMLPPTSTSPDASMEPPILAPGDVDNIAWISRLHNALSEQGFHSPVEEEEDWVFGSGTAEAVLAAQATAGLQQTGVVDAATWAWLLRGGPVLQEEEEVMSNAATPVGADVAEVEALATSTATCKAAAWPVLMEGDGGREVALLQQALERLGFACGDDEQTWWQFGDHTLNALRTMQACAGLPETGVSDETTWKELIRTLGGNIEGLEALGMHLESVLGSDISGQQSQGRLWLLGEQRWETGPQRL